MGRRRPARLDGCSLANFAGGGGGGQGPARLGNAAYHANIIAYTAAGFNQTAKEDDTLGHGLFSYAMVEALEGMGGIEQQREITTKFLADYVIKRVEELAKAQNASQEPRYFKGRDAEDNVLATWRPGCHP